MEKEKFELKFNDLIFSQGNDYTILEKVFFDYWPSHLSLEEKGLKQGSLFSGATGSTVSVITREEIAERLKDAQEEGGQYHEYWQMAVKDGKTSLGFSEWLESSDLLDNEDHVYERAPESCYEAMKKAGLGDLLNNGNELDMTGCGRCFDFEELLEFFKEDDQRTFYNTQLIPLIMTAEAGFKHLLAEEYAHNMISLEYPKDKEEKRQQTLKNRHLKALMSIYFPSVILPKSKHDGRKSS